MRNSVRILKHNKFSLMSICLIEIIRNLPLSSNCKDIVISLSFL